MKRILIPSLILLFVQAAPVAAHNGAVAVAVSVDTITVDGDLSDWPAGLRSYPIRIKGEKDGPQDADDIQGTFRVSYNSPENVLYVAVEVQDESVVEEPQEDRRPWTQDGCELFLEVHHQKDQRALAQYILWGHTRQVRGAGSLEDVEVAVQRDGRGHRYEWRVDINRLSRGRTALQENKVLGFDVALWDRDADDTVSYLMWGRGADKNNHSDRFGDLVLAGAERQPGRIQGRLHWAGTDQWGVRRLVQVVSPAVAGLAVQVVTDRAGTFAVDMPAGPYQVAADLGREEQPVMVALEPGGTSRVDLAVALPGDAVGRGVRSAPVPRRHRLGRWQEFGVADGLPSSSLRPILQDKAGHIWVGTMGDGVSRYDGTGWTTFTTQDGLVDNSVHAILEDRTGGLWFGSSRGLSRYDGHRFVPVEVDEGDPPVVSAMVEDGRGHLWLGTWNRGALRYDGQGWTAFTTQDGLGSNDVGAMMADRRGHLWFGSASSNNEGVSRYDGERFTSFVDEDGLLRNQVLSMAEDGTGGLWFGMRKGQIIRYDGEHFHPYAILSGLDGKRVEALIADRGGQLWAGLRGDGINRFDGEEWTAFSLADGLPNDQIIEMAADREGGVWFSFMGGGLGRYDEGLVTLTKADGLPDNLVKCVLEDSSGHLWAGTRSGASRYDGEQITTFTAADGLYSDYIWTGLVDGKGDVWFGMWDGGGLIRYDGQIWTRFTTEDGLAGNRVISLAEDSSGHLWAGTGRGASRYDGEKWSTFTTGDGLVANNIQAILADRRGRLWFGTSQGISRYDGGQWTTFTTQDGLADNAVNSLVEDRHGQLWIGTWFGGVSRYDGEGWTTFNKRDGLTSNTVLSILADRRGHLWFGTWGGGVTRYDGRVMQTLLRADGLPHNGVQHLTQARNGDILIATEGGIARYKPADAPPEIRLVEITADRRYEPEDKIRLPSSQGFVRVHFQGASLGTPPERMKYVYRLRGHEDEWRPTGAAQVAYTDLPLGRYTFQVKAVDRDFNYSAPAAVDLEVYYQPLVSPLRIDEIALEPLYASFYKTYARQPLGTVELVNDGPDSARVNLGFFLPDWMRRRSDQELVLGPKSTTPVPLYAALDAGLLEVAEMEDVPAEITLSFEAADETISIQKTADLTIYGRGALTWDQVARAAAFITPTDPPVAAFARPLTVAFESSIEKLGLPGQHLLQAMLLFEALKAHGVRYVADANTPYARARADRSAVDHIQYPAQLLQGKAGDCDDLTVLYASLLESVGIATALVDAPGHIFLLFDAGVSRRQAYQLPLEPRRYVVRGERLWIPVEITQVDQSFFQAWQTGSEALARLEGAELFRRTVDTAVAWEQFPATNPVFAIPIQPPQPRSFQASVTDQAAALKAIIDEYIDETYLDRLQADPDNDGLRTRLLKVYLALGQVEKAIHQGATFLLDERGDQAATLTHLGNAYALKGDMTQAALYYKQALALRPENRGLRRNLDLALQALGRTQPSRTDSLAVAATGGPKAGAAGLNVESFYWIE